MSLITLSNPTTHHGSSCFSEAEKGADIMQWVEARLFTLIHPEPQWTGLGLGCVRSKGQTRALSLGMSPSLKIYRAGGSCCKSKWGHHHLPQKMPFATARHNFSADPSAQALLGKSATTGGLTHLPFSAASSIHLLVYPFTEHSLNTYNVPGAVPSTDGMSGSRTQPCSSSMTPSRGV